MKIIEKIEEINSRWEEGELSCEDLKQDYLYLKELCNDFLINKKDELEEYKFIPNKEDLKEARKYIYKESDNYGVALRLEMLLKQSEKIINLKNMYKMMEKEEITQTDFLELCKKYFE